MKKFHSWSRINAQNILRAVGTCTGRNRDVFFNRGGKGILVLCYLCVEIVCITANKPELKNYNLFQIQHGHRILSHNLCNSSKRHAYFLIMLYIVNNTVKLIALNRGRRGLFV